jgi:hypothetical protein
MGKNRKNREQKRLEQQQKQQRRLEQQRQQAQEQKQEQREKQQRRQKGKGKPAAFSVDIDSWQRYQRFENVEGQLRDAVAELNETWAIHVSSVYETDSAGVGISDVDSSMRRINELMLAVARPPESPTQNTVSGKQKKRDRFLIYGTPQKLQLDRRGRVKKIKVATIRIEDVSTGDL